MGKLLKSVKSFLLDLFFPPFCFSCKREGAYLCEDCQGILEINRGHKEYFSQNLSDLYFPLEYKHPLVERLIQKFKYEPFIKELAKTLAYLIISHLQLIEKSDDFSEFSLLAVPLDKKRMKWRGFNQAEEIAKEMSFSLKIPLISGCLIKTKPTLPQVDLSEEQRKENIKDAFSVKDERMVRDKKILLIDDVFTTGATLKECAKTLRMAGAREVIGVVVARG